MEYGAVGWDPYRQNQIDSIEKIQRKAAKYVKMGKGHGEEIVKDLGWELLKSRRRKTRLAALFKAQMGHKAWTDINARLATPSYLVRADHIRKFKCRKQRTDVAKFSFVNRIIVDWNSLPAAIFQRGPLKINTFKERLRRLTENVIGEPQLLLKGERAIEVVLATECDAALRMISGPQRDRKERPEANLCINRNGTRYPSNETARSSYAVFSVTF
ncbi:hypothetical protein ANN_15671 [Periplaneta americana]|uniref:Uncharacterized protein n=1 Tax=Periplaneta americana TaxID=6978 RepID=A0ABQ8SI59_PERAM|nr:hypothetical protein ANN_15671 [Periplaneta americana]